MARLAHTFRPATEAQRVYLSDLLDDADISWESLLEEADLRTVADGPYDGALSLEDARRLIRHLQDGGE